MATINDNLRAEIAHRSSVAAHLQRECENKDREIARLAESGTGYSQQTVDAIVMERDALRGIVALVRRELGDRCHLGCTDRFCVTVTRLHDILDATEVSQ